jgi:hypothetical protein
MRGGEAVLQPVEAEVGDRRHIDQHLGDHHEQDGEDEELARQPETRRAGGVGIRLLSSHIWFGHAADLIRSDARTR